MTKTYSELSSLETFEDRFNYLKLNGEIGSDTFGFDRYLNQTLYRSPEWKKARNKVILRDNGCDLGIPDRPINGKIIIHHLNPITKEDVINRNPLIMDPDYLVCCSHLTHNAIHYSNEDILPQDPIERKVGDTKLW